MSIISEIQAIAHAATRVVHGEIVTLQDRDGIISTEIDDAVVSIATPIAGGVGEGPGAHRGVLRLHSDYRPAALTSLTATVRGHRWEIVGVGDVFAESFRIEIRRDEEQHSNLFDLDGQQAVWSDSE